MYTQVTSNFNFDWLYMGLKKDILLFYILIIKSCIEWGRSLLAFVLLNTLLKSLYFLKNTISKEHPIISSGQIAIKMLFSTLQSLLFKFWSCHYTRKPCTFSILIILSILSCITRTISRQ